MKKPKVYKDTKLAVALLAPSILLIVLLIGYPMIYNFIISFQKIPLNPRLAPKIVGIKNYSTVITDVNFYKSLFLTVLYTFFSVAGSTAVGLGVAIFVNRNFRFKGTARSLIILPYIVPSISLVFAWKYMFNNIYGIINYMLVDKLHILSEAPLWFDNPTSAFILVVLFSIWKFFPYAFLSFLAILQTLDSTLYEAAEIDGANRWQQFLAITIPCIKPVLMVVITLRTIWVFYMFADVYLLTKKVNILGVYLYEMAFARNDLGKAAAISILLFVIIFAFIIFIRKKVDINEQK
ncbi:carbohydrate ABC transporter permease [Sebaldella sp. S0638]|uniref:carbohydrate ABC transporter permease n=1 Tax=Sebaldella sp. S0638 TaxID=2957809 RepID=UPI0020A17579|nr:sugar ABC transporter permease [Sebaldella sp. S0638]MCP1225561.1 sugar ABC transporter permease [Sebaldella sp. S0638]